MKLFRILSALALAFAVSACQPSGPDDDGPSAPAGSGITNVKNSYEGKAVSYRGGTISIKFDSSSSWTAALDAEHDWVEISSSPTGEAGTACTVRLAFKKNETEQERTVGLYVTVDGLEPVLVATLTQAASGMSADAAINQALNTYMHDILKDDYLFKDAYNEQDIDLTLNYKDFLDAHLKYLGNVNIADGGYYRASHENAGERYIYTNIQEIVSVSTFAVERPMAVQTGGLGFGPFISTALKDDGSTDMGIAPAYVRQGSPAEQAGLRRGDLIYAVNGTRLTMSNYRNYMNSLYQNPVGTYTFSYLRYVDNGNGGYDHLSYDSPEMTAGPHVYDPVLHASILTHEGMKIGYLVYESFDLASQEFLENAVEWFVSEGIDEMILDLRFNAGGAVAQSRWLSGCIAGSAHKDDTFTKVVFNDGTTENWTFGYGYTNETDPLGLPKDLGLERLYVICSYNTGSAAELVISSLRGIDFPVKLIGCRTEGKNVGMTVSETTYNGRRFQFSPVTFWVRNAKDWGDYADGMVPDEYVNNDNGDYSDDADNVFPYSFGDWDNKDYNIALQWAWCDITGVERWKHTPSPSGGMSVKQAARMPLAGNLVYENN